MLRLTLDEADVQVLVNSFFHLDDLDDVNLRERPGLRYALANIVGDIRSQYAPSAVTPGPQRARRRVDLASLLADRFGQWNRMFERGEVSDSADDVINAALSRSGRPTWQFEGEGDSGDAVLLLAWEFDGSLGWDRCELRLCSRTDGELERMTFADLVMSLVEAGSAL
jgi:hypothetical protein